MPMTWNADADQKLLAAILKTSDVKVDYAAVATVMGPECTAKAIIHRVRIIKNLLTNVGIATANNNISTTPVTTPVTTPRKRKATTTSAENGNDDDEAETPSKVASAKKPRTPRGKTVVVAAAAATASKGKQDAEGDSVMGMADDGEDDANGRATIDHDEL